MQRRLFLQHSAFLMASLGVSSYKFPFDTPYKIKELRNGVGVFTERGGTIAFASTSKGIAVVDSQFPEQSNHLIEALKGMSENPIKLLFNTHHHGDHSGGNISFKGIVEHVIAHENSLKNQKAVAEKQNTVEKQVFPDITYQDTHKEKLGKETIKMHYFGAGHTNGDSIIHFERANVAHCGDLVFNRRFPVVDRNAGASMNSWINVLDKINATFDKDTIFVFGHAFDPEKITGTHEDIKAFKNYLEQLLGYVSQEIKAGKSKEEILKTTAIPNAPEWKGDGIQRSLTAAYDELTSK